MRSRLINKDGVVFFPKFEAPSDITLKSRANRIEIAAGLRARFRVGTLAHRLKFAVEFTTKITYFNHRL